MVNESKPTPKQEREELFTNFEFSVKVPEDISLLPTEPIFTTEDAVGISDETGASTTYDAKPKIDKHPPAHLRSIANQPHQSEKQPIVPSVPVSSAEDFSKHEDITADTFTEDSLWHQAGDLGEGDATLIETIDPKSVRKEALKRSARRLSKRVKSLLLAQKT